MGAFNKDLAESGELVDTGGLTAPVHARRLRFQEGVPVCARSLSPGTSWNCDRRRVPHRGREPVAPPGAVGSRRARPALWTFRYRRRRRPGGNARGSYPMACRWHARHDRPGRDLRRNDCPLFTCAPGPAGPGERAHCTVPATAVVTRSLVRTIPHAVSTPFRDHSRLTAEQVAYRGDARHNGPLTEVAET
jgi:hypothetical protein